MSKKALPKSCLILIVLTFISIVNLAMGRAWSNKPAKDHVTLMVDLGVYKELKQEILQYKSDVELNFPVQLTIVKGDWDTPDELRADIRKLYYKKNLKGVILTGALPMHKFYMQDIAIPNPLYYEAFEMEFVDRNGDGISDAYIGKPDLKVWVANLRGVEGAEDQGIYILREFFNKTHAYYSGKQNIERRALAITGKDWPDGANEFADKIGLTLFGSNSVDVLSCNEATRTAIFDAFKNHTYSMFYIQIHSNESSQKMEPGTIYSKEIAEITTGSVFTINHGCSTGNWAKAALKGERNTAMSWVFGQGIGEATVANVRTGMVYGHDSIYARILNGDYLGKAYLAGKKAGELEMNNEFPDGSIVSGVTFIGNPFIYIYPKK